LFLPAAWLRRVLLPSNSYRPPGGGVSVDPLGEGLIRLLPDGFKPLFAPPVALPARPLPVVIPLFRPPPVAAPGEVPMVVPFMDEPVVLPLVADPPAEPAPVWAKATLLDRASATASPMLVNFMRSSSCCEEEEPEAQGYVPVCGYQLNVVRQIREPQLFGRASDLIGSPGWIREMPLAR
jgi:hypothetical protein